MNIEAIRYQLERRKGQRQQIEQTLVNLRQALKDLERSIRRHEQAREIIQRVGLETQQLLSYHISGIATLALEAVFDDPYELVLEFVRRRNKTECDIYFQRDNYRVEPIGESGVGAVDIAAFALRVACWSMKTPRTRNVLILDEPFKHLKGEEANKRALEMIKQISRKLGLQIIMVSDERISREATIAATDRLFETSIKNRVTQIEVS